jgi:hypothetical protein
VKTTGIQKDRRDDPEVEKETSMSSYIPQEEMEQQELPNVGTNNQNIGRINPSNTINQNYLCNQSTMETTSTPMPMSTTMTVTAKSKTTTATIPNPEVGKCQQESFTYTITCVKCAPWFTVSTPTSAHLTQVMV